MTPFKWDDEDQLAALALSSALTHLGNVELSHALIESSIELDGIRPPRESDAWRFFHAARVLSALPPYVAKSARMLGSKIGREVMHVEVIDCHRIDAGASTAYVFHETGRDLPRVETYRPMGAR